MWKRDGRYGDFVFYGLHSVSILDGMRNPHPLTDDQREAIDFLDKYGGASPNDVKNIDLRCRGFTTAHFPWVMSALMQLSVETIRLDSNPWSEGVGPHLHDYRRFVIASMNGALYVPYCSRHPCRRLACR